MRKALAISDGAIAFGKVEWVRSQFLIVPWHLVKWEEGDLPALLARSLFIEKWVN